MTAEVAKIKNEIILYQPDSSIQLDVMVENETVWLTQAQMVALFDSSKANISEHIKNIYDTHELDKNSTVRKFRTVQKEGKREVVRQIDYFNLDMIIALGYRVNTKRGTEFRIWATKTLKEYLLRGYAVNYRFQQVDEKLMRHEQILLEHQKQIDFIVRTEIPPKEGIFYDGQIFDAYKFVSDLIESAKKRIIVIDNYVDASVLTLLLKRRQDVTAILYTKGISDTLKLDLQRHNAQYPEIFIEEKPDIHDRFLLIDSDLYHIGASLKDLGKKLFAFSKMEMKSDVLLSYIE
jgi:hypothetical protein